MSFTLDPKPYVPLPATVLFIPVLLASVCGHCPWPVQVPVLALASVLLASMCHCPCPWPPQVLVPELQLQRMLAAREKFVSSYSIRSMHHLAGKHPPRTAVIEHCYRIQCHCGHIPAFTVTVLTVTMLFVTVFLAKTSTGEST